MATPIRIRGIIYPSIKDAARKIGCSPQTIRKALDQGRIDDLTKPITRREVTIRGVTYSSHGEASRALNVSTNCVSIAAREGWLNGVGLRKAARK
jgi:transposase-like protein